MANSETIKTTIDVNINTNGNQEITGAVMNSVLKQMVASTDAQFAELESKNDTQLSDLAKVIETLQTEMESQSVLIEDLQDNKVDRDGYEPDLSVGVADHLAGHDEPTPSEFTFRKSGGGAILSGNARVQSVKGNSVVWNQLINEIYLEANDATITKTDMGYTIVPTGNAPGLRTNAANGNITPIVGHKYAIIWEKVGGSRGKYLNWGGFNASLTGPIFTATDATRTQLTIYSYNETETFTITTPLLIDLTQMFGAGNEPTTIEDFYSRIPQGIDMDAYNEGEVIHMNVDAVKSVGFNAWDEEWEKGAFDVDTGANYDSSQIRSKNLIPVVSGASYKITTPQTTGIWIMFLNSEGDIVAPDNTSFQQSGMSINVKGTDPRSITIPYNAAYMRFYAESSYGDTYNHDICINLSDTSINGKYYPYVSRKQSLDMLSKYFPQGMKSAGTAHDEVRYNKTTQKWEAVMRIAEVDMGSLMWQLNNDGRFEASFPSARPSVSVTEVGGVLCRKYTAVSALDTYNGINGISIDNVSKIWIRDSAYTNAASFKAAMQGVILYYELANPIVTEIADAFNLDYEVWNGGTEQAIADTPTSAFKADIIYGFNAYGVIKELREQLATLQAAIAKMNV